MSPRTLLAAVVAFWFALALYGASLVGAACLFVHERYGIVLPIVLLGLPVIWVCVNARSSPAGGAAVGFGLALGVLGGGAVFWVHYAFYAQGAATRALLGLAAAMTVQLAVTSFKGHPGRRGQTIGTFFYAVAVIAFGQGVPDDDVKRPNALSAARAVQSLGARLSAHVARHGSYPLRLDQLEGIDLVLEGYSLFYEPRARGTVVEEYDLAARPHEYGRSGCHSFWTDHTRRMTYTRCPRDATREDRQWR